MDSLDELTPKELNEFIQDFDAVTKMLKGLIFKYEDLINVLDASTGKVIIETVGTIDECLHKIKQNSA